MALSTRVEPQVSVFATAPAHVEVKTTNPTPAATLAAAPTPPEAKAPSSVAPVNSSGYRWTGLLGIGQWMQGQFSSAKNEISEKGCSASAAAKAAVFAVPAGLSAVSIFACCPPPAKGCGWDGFLAIPEAVIILEKALCTPADTDERCLINTCCEYAIGTILGPLYLLSECMVQTCAPTGRGNVVQAVRPSPAMGR